MSWVSLADEVAAIRFLLEHEVAGPVNLTAPSPVTNEVFTKTLGRVLHRPTFLPVPSFGPKLLVGAELAQALLYDGQRVLPDALLDAGFEFRHTDLETTLHELLG
jgi:NAD dependent epimerase/dehydratase family enzyme